MPVAMEKHRHPHSLREFWGVAPQETEESREGEILNNCKQKTDIKSCRKSVVFFFLKHECVLVGKAHVFRVNSPCI